MDEQLISFRTAQLAKEKGYLLPCKNWYNFSGLLIKGDSTPRNPANGKFASYSAPSQSVLQKWLREVHDIHISVNVWDEGNGNEFSCDVISSLIEEDTEDNLSYSTYEEALEEGLYQALQLIK